MTVPSKKSSTAKRAGPKSAGSGAKAAAAKKETAARKGSAKKKAPAKKKAGGKKSKNASLHLPVLCSFLAGIILACALFWLVQSDVLSPKAPAPARTAQTKSRAAGKAAPVGQSGVVRGFVDPEAEREAARANAIASALHELQNLPYEEPLHASLDERIRQVDYALMQAMEIRGVPLSALRLAGVEERRRGGELYHFQRIDILPGSDTGVFADAVRGSLAIWAEEASLRHEDPRRWSILLDGVRTHEILLHPHRQSLPPLQGTAGAEPSHAPEPPRARGHNESPKLVIVIDDLGASKSALDTLLSLNYPVSCAFWPHGAYTRKGAVAAHAKGREVLVHLPMEPLGYPQVKPGPNVLLVGMSAAEKRRIVTAAVAAVPHAVGLNNHMGSRFTQDAPSVDTVLSVLREQGLFMLDSLTHNRSVFFRQAGMQGIARYRRNVFLDVDPTKEKVLEELRRAERIALLTGYAVAIGHPLPGTLAALKEWQHLRNKDVLIVRLRDLR